MADPLKSMCKCTVDGYAGMMQYEGRTAQGQEKTGCLAGHSESPCCCCLIEPHQQKPETYKTPSSPRMPLPPQLPRIGGPLLSGLIFRPDRLGLVFLGGGVLYRNFKGGLLA